MQSGDEPRISAQGAVSQNLQNCHGTEEELVTVLWAGVPALFKLWQFLTLLLVGVGVGVVQAKRENNVKMINDLRDAVDSVDPDRDTFAYSDK